jgi:hypothetical protein
MSVTEWFGTGVSVALALFAWRRCVMGVMWSWNDDSGANIPVGLFFGSVVFISLPLWLPVWAVIKAWEKVDFSHVLTERVFPKPKGIL